VIELLRYQLNLISHFCLSKIRKNMQLRLGKHQQAAFVASLALISCQWSHVEGFTTSPWRSSSSLTTHASPGFFGVSSPKFESSSSSLQMGFVEEFMTGRDDATRETSNKKYLAEQQVRVERINAMEPTVEDLGDDELQAKTTEFCERLRNGEDINGPILEEAFAVVREAAW
jgi:hypothetical protein